MIIREKEYQDLIEQLTVLKKMYEQTRIVDPVHRKVLYSYLREGEDRLVRDEACFGCWERDEACVNCVSMRAFREDDTFFKLETGTEKIIMVTAVPVSLRGERLVVELLKDVTGSMILDEQEMKGSAQVKRLLDAANLAAVTDELTGAYNRRYVSERLPVDIAAARLRQQPLALLLADIDFFKAVNDTHGHSAGDHVLREFVAALRASIRHDKDWVARLGGEEFLVCLTDTSSEGAARVAERMRRTVESTSVCIADTAVQVTSSFGLCNLDECPSADDAELIACADRRLYQAKRTGRNRVAASDIRGE